MFTHNIYQWERFGPTAMFPRTWYVTGDPPSASAEGNQREFNTFLKPPSDPRGRRLCYKLHIYFCHCSSVTHQSAG